MNSNTKVKMLVEGAMMIALAYILSLVKIWEMPSGGSVTAGSMIPILIYAFRWGGVQGVFVGMVSGLIQFILGPKWSFHIISILFDYILAFGALGVVGFFAKRNASLIKAVVGIVIGVGLRFVCSVVSGVVVFGSYAPEGQSPFVYSMVYNASYLVPELVISIVIFILLFKPLKRANI